MVSLNELKNKDVVIFGTGLEAVRCAYYLNKQGISIKYFLNNDKKIDFFYGKPVYLPVRKQADNVYILIAVREIKTYLNISKQLSDLKFREFKDYLFYKWIDRKLVLLHGNCHMTIIKSFLESSQNFLNKYAIYPNALIYENKDKMIDERVLKNCDVWVHEDIQKDNIFSYFLSDEYIRAIFAGEREIIIPHLFGLGQAFFPQSPEKGVNKCNAAIANGEDFNGMFPHADKVIDKCVEENMNVENIISFCKSSSALSTADILGNFKKYMDKIKDREKGWDIKIYNFILSNYKKEKLFYDKGHPTNIILKKISLDILFELGLQEDCICTDLKLDAYENPIYPIVAQCLELKWDEIEIRKSTYAKKMCVKMDFDEYIREYVQWSYGE